jgi:PAS domain S-box-containing protein
MFKHYSLTRAVCHVTLPLLLAGGIGWLMYGGFPSLPAWLSPIAARSADFMPHGYCYLWDPWIVWLNVVSDGLITLSYYCIPIVLIYFIRKNRDLPFNQIFWMFGTFILACGTTHLMEIWNVWHGSYLLAGVVKAVTAAVSVLTAAMLIPLVPKVISLPGRMHLQEKNRKLEQESAARHHFNAPIEGPLRRRVAIGFIGAVLLTVFIGFSSWRNARLTGDDADWVAHTYAVMDTIELTSKHVIEAETSARAFALSGQDLLLAHYESARGAVAPDEKALRQLTADNPGQQRRLDVFEPQVRTALEFAEDLVSKRRQQQAFPRAGEMLETERLMSAVRATAHEMKTEELQLLALRTQRTKAGRGLTSFIIFVGIFIGAGMLALARIAVNRQIDVSSRARAQLAALNSELEERVEQRTATLQSEIAERKRVEAANEQALKELADQKFALDQHAIVAVTDVQGNITYVNDKFCTISQYSRDELLGQNHRILNSGHHPREFFQQMYHAIANGQVWRGEICNRAEDGSIYWVDTTIVPTLNPEGKPSQYVAIRADITESKLAAEVLVGQALELSRQAEELARSRHALETQTLILQSEARYRGLLEAAPDAMVVVNQGGEIVLLNAQAEKQFGYWRDELVGQKVTNIIPEGFAERLIADGTRSTLGALAQQIGTGIELSGRRKDGSEFPIEIMLSPLESAEGILVTAAIRDISLRKQTQEHLVKTAVELKRSNDELEQFAYVSSHDLQEPLRMVASYTQLLARRYKGRLDSDADEFIAFAVDGCNRMQGLIQDLLAYSRAGTNGKVLREISSEDALKEALTNLRATIEQSGAVVTHDSLPTIRADETQLTQVFQNLVGNAIKYRSAEVPHVCVSATKNGGNEWVFSVQDNGLGIAPQYFERIFILFQRLHGRNEFEGTGIGLAICKKIVERQGGRIWVESQPEKGSTFYFALPEGNDK